MEAVHLFLNIDKPGLNNDWNTTITAALKALSSIDQVQIIEQNEESNALISITYNVQKLSINDIEKVVQESGANITDINIHFPSGLTGIADPYGASAASLKVDDILKKIEGVVSGTISSKGQLKVLLDNTFSNRQSAIDKILQAFSS